MSYRLKGDETVPDGLKRVVVEQIDEALDGLESQGGSQDDAIHDARVCFKKIRAALRLVQSELGADIFRQENLCYRDAGRQLSAMRDTTALLETFGKLSDRFADQLAPDAFADVLHSLRQSGKARRLEKKNAMLAVAKAIGAARRRVEQWPVQQDGFSALGQGLQRVYKQGRRSFVHAITQPSVENFHEWRKEVKYLRYQIRLLKPMWSTMLARLGDELEALGESLSEDHDLALLRQRVLEPEQPMNNERDLEALIALIDRRRTELQAEAEQLGKRIYAEKPRTFSGRLGVYWQAWRSEGSIDSSAVIRR